MHVSLNPILLLNTATSWLAKQKLICASSERHVAVQIDVTSWSQARITHLKEKMLSALFIQAYRHQSPFKVAVINRSEGMSALSFLLP